MWLDKQKIEGFVVSENPFEAPVVDGWLEEISNSKPLSLHQCEETEAKKFAKKCEDMGLSANIVLWKDWDKDPESQKYKASVELLDLTIAIDE